MGRCCVNSCNVATLSDHVCIRTQCPHFSQETKLATDPHCKRTPREIFPYGARKCVNLPHSMSYYWHRKMRHRQGFTRLGVTMHPLRRDEVSVSMHGRRCAFVAWPVRTYAFAPCPLPLSTVKYEASFTTAPAAVKSSVRCTLQAVRWTPAHSFVSTMERSTTRPWLLRGPWTVDVQINAQERAPNTRAALGTSKQPSIRLL